MTAEGTPQSQSESLQRALAVATERAEKAEKHISSLMDEIDKADAQIATLTRERDEAWKQQQIAHEYAEILAELRDLRQFKAAHETPKGSAGVQCCDPVIDGEISALRERLRKAEADRGDEQKR